MGHVITKDGIEVDQIKIESIAKWLVLYSICQLRGFLGLTKYYHQFVQDYASIVAPLFKLLCKDKFIWIDQATTTFEALKKCLTWSTQILHLPNFKDEFLIETDASNCSSLQMISSSLVSDIIAQIKKVKKIDRQYQELWISIVADNNPWILAK